MVGKLGKSAFALCLAALSYNAYNNLTADSVYKPIQLESYDIQPQYEPVELKYNVMESDFESQDIYRYNVIETELEDDIITTDFDREVHCMASNLYFESKNQPIVDMYAVGHVVLNRLSDDGFPRRINGKIANKEQRKNASSVCDIVHDAKLDAKGNQVKDQCQFSWYCDGKPEVVMSKEKWAQAEMVAIKLLLSKDMFDFTSGALYYHADYVSPEWAKSHIKTLQVKNHIYYR